MFPGFKLNSYRDDFYLKREKFENYVRTQKCNILSRVADKRYDLYNIYIERDATI